MASLITGDLWQVRVYCQAQNQVAINVYHYRVGGTTGVLQTDAAFAARMDALLGPLYTPLMSDVAEYRGVGVQRLSPLPPTVEVYSAIQAGPGESDDALLPKQTCGLITKRTASAGRKYRGRAYIPFASEEHNEDGSTPSGGYLAALLTLANQLEAEVQVGAGGNVTALAPIIFHRLDTTYDLITECTVNDKWATQRRRGDYGRINVSPI